MENNVKKDSYSLREFMDNLKEKVLSFGIDPKCAENPAFETVFLEDVKSFVDTCGVDDYTKAMVEETEEYGRKEISFKYIGDGNTEYGFRMCDFGDDGKTNRLSFNKWKDKKYSDRSEYYSGKKNYGFSRANQDADYNLNVDDAVKYSSGNEREGYSTYLTRKISNYTSDGIEYRHVECSMHPHDIKPNYLGLDVRTQIRNVDTFNPRAYEYSNSKLEVSRKYLDVASVRYEEYEGYSLKKRVSGDGPISQHSLSELPHSFMGSDEYVIPSLSEYSINEMISREKNSKIAEGLRKYTDGRSTYSYDPSTAPDFEYYSSDSANRSR